jgi:hypothetical protein
MTIEESPMERFLRRAREARQRAATTSDPFVRKSMDEIAEAFEALAEKEEQAGNEEDNGSAE